MCDQILKDAQVVAAALLEDYWFHNNGDYGHDEFSCQHCDGESPWYAVSPEEIRHIGNCPVLVAKDLLTGSDPAREGGR